MITSKERKKYKIESTTPGFPELDLALHKAAEKIGWKSLTCHLVRWTEENQPDSAYSLKFWINKH